MDSVVFKKKNRTREKTIVIITMIFSVIMIVFFGYLLYVDIQNRPLVNYPKYTLSNHDWTNGNVIITILNDENNISSYSFDGGKNYQQSDTYEVVENSDVYIMVKDINGRSSNMIPISIKIIDKEAPIINFENNTVVQVGSNFSVRNGVQAYDTGSGLSSNYVTVPDKIDTNVVGEYEVKYTVFDKVGNYTEKTRKIVVTDVKGTTYYRYRDATIESYQCDGYSCNCVVTDSALSSQTCPSGYTYFEPDKCCQTCYKTCKKTIWGEWSEWSTNRVTPNATREVETKVE